MCRIKRKRINITTEKKGVSICRVCVWTCIHFLNCCSLNLSFMEANVSLSRHLGHNYMCWGPRRDSEVPKGSVLEGSHPSCFLFPVLSALHSRDLTHSDRYQRTFLMKKVEKVKVSS